MRSTKFGRALLALADAASARTALGVVNDASQRTISLTSHGLSVGDVVRYEAALSVAFVASAQSTDVTSASSIGVSIPAGLQAGDLLILKVEWLNTFGSSDNSVSATGFTSLGLARPASTANAMQVLYRVLDGTESYISAGGTVTASFAGGNLGHITASAFSISYRGASSSSPLTTASVLSSNSFGGGYSTSYSTDADNEVLLQLAYNFSKQPITFSSPAGGTVRQARDDPSSNLRSGTYEVPVASASSVTAAASWTATSNYGAVITAIRPSGALPYAKALADSEAHAEAIGVVVAVPDANTFVLQQVGYTAALSGLTAAAVYYLSPTTAGAVTSTKPTTSGQVIRPVLVAVSATEGYIIPQRGTVIP